MVLEIADMNVLPGKQAAFEAAVARGLGPVHARGKGMRGYWLHHCIEAPNRYLLQVQWDTVEDRLTICREDELSPEFGALIMEFFSRPPVVRRFELVIRAGGC